MTARNPLVFDIAAGAMECLQVGDVLDVGAQPGVAAGGATIGVAVTLTAVVAPGDFVSLGASGVVLADAANTAKPADGFVTVAGTIGGTGVVLGPGLVNGLLSSLTPGAIYYLASSGAITSTKPTSGVLQIVGKAADATHLLFNPGPSTLL